MALIDPESLMFSLPRWRLPWDYFKKIEPSPPDPVMVKMTITMKQAFKTKFERDCYEILKKEIKNGGIKND